MPTLLKLAVANAFEMAFGGCWGQRAECERRNMPSKRLSEAATPEAGHVVTPFKRSLKAASGGEPKPVVTIDLTKIDCPPVLANDWPWVVAIPSFDRVKSIGKETLALLLPSVDPRRIFIFADPRQFEEYAACLRHLGVNVVRGERGICAQRNSIMQHFMPGAHIVEIDDDIRELMVTTASKAQDTNAKGVGVPVANFARVVDHLWAEARKEGCGLWGVYGVNNPFLKSWTHSVGLAKSTAQLQGYVRPHKTLNLTVPVMEDYERCLAFYRRRWPSLRADYLSVRTDNRGRGGCLSAFAKAGADPREARRVAEDKAAAALRYTFGDLIDSVAVASTSRNYTSVRLRADLVEKRAASLEGEYAILLGLLETGNLPTDCNADGSSCSSSAQPSSSDPDTPDPKRRDVPLCFLHDATPRKHAPAQKSDQRSQPGCQIARVPKLALSLGGSLLKRRKVPGQ